MSRVLMGFWPQKAMEAHRIIEGKKGHVCKELNENLNGKRYRISLFEKCPELLYQVT